VALLAMVQVKRRIKAQELSPSLTSFTDAALLLKAARPTNTTMARALDTLLSSYQSLDEAMDRIEEDVTKSLAQWDEIYHRLGKLGGSLIGDDEGILTTCFGEHTVLYSLAYAREAGKHIRLYVNETRPYLQGSRLTAPSAHQMGIDVTIIGDGMGATLMREGVIDRYMTACDVLCMDGTVVNKTGTLSNAIACSHYRIPYHAFAISPDPSKRGEADVVTEERNPQEMKECRGEATTAADIPARYPAFDIIAASLVTSVVTPKGVLRPHEVEEAFA